jgi:hypothetical protein
LDRSLNDGRIKCHREDDSRLNTLERLVERGYFQNNRQMILSSWRLSFRRLFQVISSMNHLEKLNLLECDLSLTQDLPQLFRSCPKLTELHLTLFGMLEMGEKLENELRSGFQRLRLLEFTWDTCSLPLIQEIFT